MKTGGFLFGFFLGHFVRLPGGQIANPPGSLGPPHRCAGEGRPGWLTRPETHPHAQSSPAPSGPQPAVTCLLLSNVTSPTKKRLSHKAPHGVSGLNWKASEIQ